MQIGLKKMENQTLINDLLEKVLKLPLDEQIMISEIIQKRIIEAKRKEMAVSVKESKEEYKSGRSGRGSVDDFLKDVEND